MLTYKFNTMFRGQAVVIEYDYSDLEMKDIDCAIVTNDNPYFIHPDYEWCSDWLDKFHMEVYELAMRHIKNVVH